MKPADLKDNVFNWRRHPQAQLSALEGILSEVGWAGACLYNERTKRLIDGHARKKVALEQGTTKVPVLVGDWTEEQERKILATLDPLAAMADADHDALRSLLEGIETESTAVREMLDGLAAHGPVVLPEPGAGGDDFDADKAAEGPCRVQAGDLWLIDGGKHRLVCGDSTKTEDVSKLMDGQVADLCFTSPPYGQQRDYGAAKEYVQDWFALMCGVFANLPMADDGQVLVNLGLIHRDGEWIPYWDPWIEWMRQQGWRRFGWYVWDQGSGLCGDWNGRLAPSHEFVFHFNRQPVTPQKFVEKKPESITLAVGTFRQKDGQTRAKTSPESGLQTHKIPDSVVRITRQVGSDGHPAQFPVEFPAFAMQCWPGLAYEPFCGSGTSIIAAHRTGNRCFGMELDPKYVEVCLRRAEAEGLSVQKAR
ncbi:MAG TPA: DNA methyltransferase [Aquabacterium sp.]|nr:DNA methyltransferase [Aquabacterium sp.]